MVSSAHSIMLRYLFFLSFISPYPFCAFPVGNIDKDWERHGGWSLSLEVMRQKEPYCPKNGKSLERIKVLQKQQQQKRERLTQLRRNWAGGHMIAGQGFEDCLASQPAGTGDAFHDPTILSRGMGALCLVGRRQGEVRVGPG